MVIGYDITVGIVDNTGAPATSGRSLHIDLYNRFQALVCYLTEDGNVFLCVRRNNRSTRSRFGGLFRA